MVVVSYSGKEINAKVVYYGPGLCGKTTNLEYIYGAVPQDSRGKMVSMKTRTERTLFFDFLPVDLGNLGGFKTRFLLYTVPGQVYYNATRKLVLRGVDALVFVADSQRGKMKENLESLQNLRDNLKDYDLDLDEMPWVLQYNKRDLDDTYSVEEMDKDLNPTGKIPHYEAVATTGEGVFECFRGIGKVLLQKLSKEIKMDDRSSRAAEAVAKADIPRVEAAPRPQAGPTAAAPPPAPPAPAAEKKSRKAKKEEAKQSDASAQKPAVTPAAEPKPIAQSPAPQEPAPEPVAASQEPTPMNPKDIPVSIRNEEHEDTEVKKGGFLSRLFGRKKKEDESDPLAPMPETKPQPGPEPAMTANVEVPASGPSSDGPAVIERKVQVPVTLSPNDIARGATIRLVLEVEVRSDEASKAA